MASGDEEARLLARLDARIAAAFSGRERVTVAFSGGLASLVLAGIARKHGELRCVAVATRGAADLGAALVARDFLDYRLEAVTPTPESILRTAIALRAGLPRLTLPEVLDLIPLTLIEARWPEEPVLTGFGLAPRTAALRRCLASRTSQSPAVRTKRSGPSRRLLQGIGRELGLPDGFLLVAHRSPTEGSGIGPVLRALGHARHRSVDRLLAERV